MAIVQYGQYDLEKMTTLLEDIVFRTNSAVGPDMLAAGIELNNAPILISRILVMLNLLSWRR